MLMLLVTMKDMTNTMIEKIMKITMMIMVVALLMSMVMTTLRFMKIGLKR